MGLKPVLARQTRAVVAHRERQEMKLDVGMRHSRLRADEAARLEMIGRAVAVVAHQPVQPDERAGEQPGLAVERDRLLRGDLEIEFEMVLQILADAGQRAHDLDAELAQFRFGTDAGEFQQLRRIDRSAGENDFA